MVAYQFRMPAGIPGASNRQEASTVERQQISVASPPTAYGIGLVMDTGTGQMRAPAGADTAANIYGLYVRPYPANSSQDGLGVSTPPTSGEANVMKRGYMTVRLYGGVAVKGAMCNIGVAGATGGNVPGGITATAVTTGVVAMTNCYFMGPADATGMTEVAYNI